MSKDLKIRIFQEDRLSHFEKDDVIRFFIDLAAKNASLHFLMSSN